MTKKAKIKKSRLTRNNSILCIADPDLNSFLTLIIQFLHKMNSKDPKRNQTTYSQA